MIRRLALTAVLVAAILVPTVARAHEGHVHTVMGTVASINGPHVTIKTPDGKMVVVMLDAKTKVTQGKTTLQASALKPGDRIVAKGMEEKEMIMAATVQVGAPAATIAKK